MAGPAHNFALGKNRKKVTNDKLQAKVVAESTTYSWYITDKTTDEQIKIPHGN